MRRLILLVLPAVLVLVLAGCGGSADAYSEEEFRKLVVDEPPAGLSVKLVGAMLGDVPGVDSMDITLTVNLSPPVTKLDLKLAGTTTVTLNIIATDDVAYIDVGRGWMKAPASDDLSDLASEFGAELETAEMTAGDWDYKGEGPCGPATCWQIESSDGALMLLSKGDYTPFSITTIEDGAEVVLEIVHWGEAVDIEFPADAREVSSEEMMLALFGALMPLLGGGI